ncbi:hypothetical protein HMPREF9350_05486 [Escherichia coli MS 85-1]|uniref:Uncharacterized protein n=1 Tax=Escherichia coli MS 85-1 TaxID=679202 RepID=A0AAN3M502_ECOLX|nr:hypothetical protein HMPREF9350_05486 [Escherichia coli MS 85-1]
MHLVMSGIQKIKITCIITPMRKMVVVVTDMQERVAGGQGRS